MVGGSTESHAPSGRKLMPSGHNMDKCTTLFFHKQGTQEEGPTGQFEKATILIKGNKLRLAGSVLI